MNLAVIVGIAVLGALILWVAYQISQEQKKGSALESQLNELRRDLQTVATSQAEGSGKMATIAQNVTQRLESVTKALSDGIAQSANIAAQNQASISSELKNTQGMMERVQKQLGEFQELNRGITQATQSLESILGGAKTRGLLGEVTLERLLEDSLPAGQYAVQYRFSSGEISDAVIFLRDKKLLAVDSKFPLDAFRRIQAEGDEARRAFAVAVKGHADAIAKKYIVPQEGTLDFALMFVPSEAVYYELLMTEDAKGLALDAYCRSKRIIAVSPNTLYAHLCVIVMGLRGLQIEENAKRLFEGLSGLQKQFGTFTDVFEKLGTHLKNAQQSYNEAEKRFEKAGNTLDLLNSGNAEITSGEAQGTLSLPAASGKTGG